MPKIDVNQRRNDPTAQVELSSYWSESGYSNTKLLPVDWTEEFSLGTKPFARYHNPKRDLLIPLGRTTEGRFVTLNLSAGLSVFAAGSMLSGLGMFRRVSLLGLLKEHTPKTLKIGLIDTIDTLKDFSSIPHLIQPIARKQDQITELLDWCLIEQERRLSVADNRFVYQFNETASDSEKLPSILLVISEIGDIEIGEENIQKIEHIQGLARATEMFIICTTQRPSVNFVPGGVLESSPVKIAFQLPSSVESDLILGTNGAEKLLGQGDALYSDGNGNDAHFQGFHVDVDETPQVLQDILN